ncbi:MAG: hypothetical protein ACI9K2_004908 [Myxococcota bacterium]|jgi:hypothetical protein
MRHRALLVPLVATVFATLACSTGPAGGDEVDVEDCAGKADVEDTIRIVYDTEDSLHEMVVCGQLNRELGVALSQAITSLIGKPANAPDQVEYVGEGIYQVSTPKVVMDTWVQDGNTIVEGNLLDPADFFSGLRVDNEGLDVVLRFDDAGPLAFLLGAGKNPNSPLRLNPLEIDDAVSRVGNLKLASALTYVDALDNGTDVAYELEVSRLKLTDLAGFTPMDYELVALSGGRDDLKQSIDTLDWSLSYTDESLDGSILLGFVGGPFDLQAEYVYVDGEPDPAITVSCLDGGGKLQN